MAAPSFVTEVLATAGKLEKEDLNSQLQSLSEHIDQVKAEVYDNLHKRYGEFLPCLNATLDLAVQVNTVNTNMKSLSSKIQNEVQRELRSSSAEFQDLLQQLHEADATIAVLSRVVAIHELLQSCSAAKQHGDFLKVAKQSNVIAHLLQEKAVKGVGEVKVMKALQIEFRLQREALIYDTSEMWNQVLVWSLPEEKSGRRDCCTTLTVSSLEHTTLATLVQAMEYLRHLDARVQVFSRRLLQHVLLPLTSRVCVVKCKQMADGNSLKVEPADAAEPASPKAVFDGVLRVFKFLHANLTHVRTSDGEGAPLLMTKLRACVLTDLCEAIIRDCLARSIPTQARDLEQFAEVIAETEAFQASLVEVGFMADTDTAILEYARNVNVLFANKKCEEILEAARRLMLADVHNTVKVSNEPTSEGAVKEEKGKQVPGLDSSMLEGEVQLSASTFRLPACCISKSVCELMTMANDVLREATRSSPQCAIQLFYSVRNMFEMYASVVPIHHRDNLVEVPQFAAIHHNNCMYVAHHLLTLGHQYQDSLPPPLNQGAATFIDLVPQIRNMGTDCFTVQMHRQMSLLLECLAVANGFQAVTEENTTSSKAMKAVKQCMYQLHRLNRVWRDVLPANIMYKAIGTLLNSVVTEVISKILALVDISADEATELHYVLDVIIQGSSACFEAGTELEVNAVSPATNHCVTNWMKFQELAFILNSSMYDIKERWAAGKGPLGAVFTPNELKSLIRALFQNTDKRAAVLAKIE
ncbi:PREDICTED: centromere/kinetochore protein zw10 homolog [Priapulus caudatus]|uniref:Centromere/kinetochore protein zw10 homolog n=1 Tax=Priapulus caudatus TaxID=37621 RepID=A0ABM1EYI4_PRICU|nr:PREDICTED: centromere/kinetochore protein zw10 homolog [Priapulus caudatus]